jgi:hypothetical protein
VVCGSCLSATATTGASSESECCQGHVHFQPTYCLHLGRALHSHLQPQSAKSYEPIQERAAKRVLSDVISGPKGHQEHVKTYAGKLADQGRPWPLVLTECVQSTATVVLNIAYGRTEKVSYTDPDIRLVSECGDRLGQTLRPGSFKVESLPWLRYVPGYTKTIDRWHADELTLFRGQLDMARERLVSSRCAKGEPGSYVASCNAEGFLGLLLYPFHQRETKG